MKPEPKLLEFNKTKALQHVIHLSETRLADLLDQHEYMTHTIKLDSYLTTKFNLSVDSIMQVCFQIAYYSLYGRIVNTLEPITTRKFRDARTELVAVQNQSLANLVNFTSPMLVHWRNLRHSRNVVLCIKHSIMMPCWVKGSKDT